ncbi:MAG: polymer-forming cytoskeletal protein [Cytophagales bacterium]|nr:MAG: polymer-forming cytoskeletal protein [Cytophagales bacterium]TAF60852.1 MAG: polymer-forming cytoskeletal protein [Cytophagales bacterium]
MALFGKKSNPMSSSDIEISSIIGKSTVVAGYMKTTGNIRIDGIWKGNIESKAKVAIGDGAIIEGSIYAQNVEIQGEVLGDIVALDSVVLRASAVVRGNVYSVRMVMESGASLNGELKMNDSITKTAERVIQGIVQEVAVERADTRKVQPHAAQA